VCAVATVISRRANAQSSTPTIETVRGPLSGSTRFIGLGGAFVAIAAGSYYEPARIELAPSRVHGTGGFDVRLFEWDVFGLIKPFDWWQLSIAADGARSYLNTSFSIGFWH
jgi:hypothetical protein